MIQRIKSLLFHNTSTRQTVAKNTIWLGVSNIGGRLLRAVIIVYAARVLGASSWGSFSYALTIAAFLTVFVDIGINAIITKSIASGDNAEKRAQVLSTTFYIKAVLLTIGILLIQLVAPYISVAGVQSLIPIVVLIFAFDTLREFGFALTRALERMEYEAALFLLTNGSIVVFGFWFLSVSPTVTALAYAYAAGGALGMICTFFVFRKHFRQILTRFNPALVKPIFKQAWPFAISGILGILMLNTDILIIAWRRSPEEVGLYSAPQRIIQLLYVLPSIVATSVLPTLSRFALQNMERFKKTLERVISFMIAVAIPIAIGGVLLGSEIIRLIYGNEYRLSTVPFQILCLTLLVDFTAVILNNALFAHGQQKKLVIYFAIGGVLNVILDLALIPYYGIAGCAIATLLAQLTSNTYLWWQTKRIQTFSILPRLKRVLVAAAGMALLTYGFRQLELPVLLNIAASGLAYLGLLYALKEPLIHEMKAILRGPANPTTPSETI